MTTTTHDWTIGDRPGVKFLMWASPGRIVATHKDIQLAVAQYFPGQHTWLVADILEPQKYHEYVDDKAEAILALRRYVGARVIQ